ncbi:aminotransferase class V-fold PLP-dependent enzyme [Dictyobacter aurantiacus]|uniref:Aminotransferase class V n=1 Tax=Dictyobacter aurantiacus TaxID=1936993 RepID=A0A401ZHL0_9CHLR|nr:aminotransferase class V-fold PLP-dependent enzyme [Dictyobacter aurantiacus]GCE06273.1 aminotransferase class V [Dictyobacter aurantiacus]
MPLFDVERARQETPGSQHVLHLNNAGSSLMPQPVLEATVAHLQLEAQIGGYEAVERQQEVLEHAYDAAAALINCTRDEIAFVENATRAWDAAFYSIPFKAGDRILTSMAEYASNYIAYLQVARKTGAVVEAIPDDQYGQVSIEALRNMLDERVKLISITHVPTSGGLVNPVAEIGKVAREAGILYLVDACQSVGQMPIDVQKIGCDMLSTTGRKYLRGPRGTGFLYVRRELIEQLEPVFLDLHAATWVSKDRYEMRSDARRFENWETNYAGKIGLARAIDYALDWGIDNIWRRVKELGYNLRTQLSPIPGVIVRDRGITQCGIVTFTVEGVEPEEIKRRLAQQQINVSVAVQSSTRLDLEARGLTTMVRASVHYYNTQEELTRFSAAIAQLADF